MNGSHEVSGHKFKMKTVNMVVCFFLLLLDLPNALVYMWTKQKDSLGFSQQAKWS
jgi:hypothetical protein